MALLAAVTLALGAVQQLGLLPAMFRLQAALAQPTLALLAPYAIILPILLR